MRDTFILNPDEQFVANLKKIKANSKYCINKEKGNPENRCPCAAYRNNGDCECGMWIKDPTAEWGDT